MAATLLLLPSCTDELSASKDSNDGNATAETRTMTITATMADDGDNNGNGTTGSNTGNGNDGQAQTRVSHKSDPDGGATPGVIVKWTKGDAFKLFYKTTNSGTTEEKITEFEIKTAEAITNEGKTANFTGSLATGASGEATALYPATAALTLAGVTAKATEWSKIVLKMEGQKQTGDDNYDHLPAYDYMTAKVDDVAPLNSGNGNGNDLAFHHLAAMMTIKITGAPTGYTGTTDNSPELLTLTAGQDGSGTYGTFYRGINADGNPNKTGNNYPSPTSSINLALEGITWGDKGFTAHMMMVPTDLTDKTFTVSVRCKDGTTYQYTTKKIKTAYVAGMRYTATIPGGNDWTQATGETNAKVFNNDTKAAIRFATGSGDKTDPYIISSAEELKYLVEQVNAATYNSLTGDYLRLATDIIVEEGTDWTPIGLKAGTSALRAFAGHFDGNGHTIYGTLTNSDDGTRSDYKDSNFGFFGNISTGSVRNLHIKAKVTNTYAGSSEVFTGGLAGSITYYTEISGCSSDGEIQGGTKGSNSHTGGLIGYANNGATILNCTVSGTVTAATTSTGKSHTGGVAGYISSNGSAYLATMQSCTNHAVITGNSGRASDSYTGGIAGYASYTSISHCTNHGEVSAKYTENGGSCYVGGLIGLMDSYTNLSDSENQGKVTGGQISTGSYVSCCGGLIGQTASSISSTATNCTNSGTVEGNTGKTNESVFTGGLVGRNYGTLHLCLNTADGAVTEGKATTNNYTGGLVGYYSAGKVYDCCTNEAYVGGEKPSDDNRIGGYNTSYVKSVPPCDQGHIPPTPTTDKHISSDVNENYAKERM